MGNSIITHTAWRSAFAQVFLTLCNVFILALAFLPFTLLAQTRLVIHDNAFVRIDNGAWVVVENPATNAITTSGTDGGNIRSEGEFNRVRWQIRDNVGTYTVPFTSVTGVQMPFTYTVDVAGTDNVNGNASIVFSTYNYATPSQNILPLPPVPAGSEWNNWLYHPSDVTHMNNFFDGSLANSNQVVDRFWIVDARATGYEYASLPTVQLGFTYDPNNVNGEVRLGNIILPADDVRAQRFNSGSEIWSDYLPQGTPSAGPGVLRSVTGVPVAPADFFRSWTLASVLQPLPVRLLDFTAKCNGPSVALRWSTAVELNSEHFRVERSLDGAVFTPIGRVEAAGDSHVSTEYVLYDKDPKSVAYYRLMQVDRDGTEANLGVAVSGCDEQGITEIVNAWDDGYNLNVVVRTHSDQHHTMRLLDAGGKVMYAAPVALYNGLTTIQVPKDGMAQGVYIVRFDGPGMPMSRRVTLLF